MSALLSRPAVIPIAESCLADPRARFLSPSQHYEPPRGARARNARFGQPTAGRASSSEADKVVTALMACLLWPGLDRHAGKAFQRSAPSSTRGAKSFQLLWKIEDVIPGSPWKSSPNGAPGATVD